MVTAAAADLKRIFGGLEIVELDVGKEINHYGNYLVFDRFVPSSDMLDAGTFSFTLYVAINSINRGHTHGYGVMDQIITALSLAAQKGVSGRCRDIKLHSFSQRLFIYAVGVDIYRTWDNRDE